jgi:hypothetical protein
MIVHTPEKPNSVTDSFFQPFFGALGCTSAIVFTCFGAAYGTAKAGVGVCSMGVLRPDLIVKSTLSSISSYRYYPGIIR